MSSRWTQTQVRELLQLHAKDMTASQIGAVIGRNKNQVLGMLKRVKNNDLGLDPEKWMPRAHQDHWELDEDSLRRAIWARAKRGAAETIRRGQNV